MNNENVFLLVPNEARYSFLLSDLAAIAKMIGYTNIRTCLLNYLYTTNLYKR